MAQFYPSKTNKYKKNINYKQVLNNVKNTVNFDMFKPMELNIQSVEGDIFNNKVFDSWTNNVASINSHNSLMQHSYFLKYRTSYTELCMLSTDDLINNAIQTITRECLNKWGKVKIIDNNIMIDEQNELINKIQIRLEELNIHTLCMDAVYKTLVYGGVGIYIDTEDDFHKDKELIYKTEFFTKKKIKRLKVVEPYLFAPQKLETSNPLDKNFMKPETWYISGNGSIHSSRLYTMIFFIVPDMIKPLYNCLGISLCQLMKDKVKSAETIRQSLADLTLRFKTDIIKTPALYANAEALKDRVDLFNASKNNLGALVLSDQEDYINSITSIAGLDKIQAQAFENVASSARLPAVKLLGLTPSGFNATGEFDLKNYYDIIRGYQSNSIKPFIDMIVNLICMELGYENIAEFEFNPLEKTNELEQSQIKNTEIDAMIKTINAGLITPEDAFLELQNAGLISKGVSFEKDEIDIENINEDILI